MTRAYRKLKDHLRWRWRLLFIAPKEFLFWIPRPGYCDCCGAWCWLTNERPAYSAYDGAFICEECADINDYETDMAWRDYYSGCL